MVDKLAELSQAVLLWPGGFWSAGLLLRGLRHPQGARVSEAVRSPALPATSGTAHPTRPQPLPLTEAPLPSPQLLRPQAQEGASVGPGTALGTGLLARAHGGGSGWDRRLTWEQTACVWALGPKHKAPRASLLIRGKAAPAQKKKAEFP